MEKTIQELEEELKEAKLKKQWDDLQAELKKAKDKYLGKAWGSHSLRFDNFNRYKNHTSISVVYIEEVSLSENCYSNLSVDITFDEFKRDPGRYKIILRGLSLNLFKSDENVNINTVEFIDTLNNPCKPSLTHQVDLDVFKKVKDLVQNSVDLIYTASIKELPIYERPDWKSDAVKTLENQGCLALILRWIWKT